LVYCGLSTIAGSIKKKLQGGEIPGYDEGGNVIPEPSFADKLREYLSKRPVQQQQMDPNKANQVSQGFKSALGFNDGGYTDYRDGGHVPGQAEVSGDSPKNDTVPAMLSPGEYVVPRTQAKSPFGKKLIKLLEAHSEVMKHSGEQ
jgi:hypothetical protein